MWFSSNDIQIHDQIKVSDLRGYVLPHAGTKHTGEIISHTLRFRPTKNIKRIYIIYYPATKDPDVEGLYHEYYVPLMSLRVIFSDKIEYVGINVQKDYQIPKVKKDDLVVVSADFSHFLPLQEAIPLENKAAHSLMFRDLSDTKYNAVIDDKRSFSLLYQMIPKTSYLQWVSRSRSKGKQGVGYLSFLLRDKPKKDKKIDGMLMTSYDDDMNELGKIQEWYTKEKSWNSYRETKMRNSLKVTKYYSVTTFYKSRSQEFIEGWHFTKGRVYPEFHLEKHLISDVTLGLETKKTKKTVQKKREPIYETKTIHKSVS
jgi:predicted class III extradiol MEMO1 family dioxygenase